MSMFSSRSTDAPFPAEATRASAPVQHAATVIAHGVKVEGDFKSQGDVVIEGEVQGSVTTAGTLTVGTEAFIKADIQADDIIVSGTVEGNLTVEKQAVLHSSAKVKGDLTAERITVESGAVVDGRVQVGLPSKKAVKEESKAKAAAIVDVPEPETAAKAAS
ncbi:polymer-forming cytoskeletal protein [Patescibacteria group bacterium]|uniref:Polymer-forming cytoskeletal protein n=1 Tax=candidate division WWE3 bacterium TaxID=2053526 RepID=A0A928TQK3_UNCKA|nr:polymer-forming cytoskeletal protein [candidate division WWE3 bacterium]MCL4732339.1 polymer-forming cytoskeletal protein [Patescibacteria group bacterium]MDL1952764.1 polymer-forming cytoskeletal protein [Candidatus Uhrbacteria bacterium UHB]RIL01000.1 MAG: hypothetical protein DCC77_00455 [Candidatus Uhrbacteria bacterium]